MSVRDQLDTITTMLRQALLSLERLERQVEDGIDTTGTVSLRTYHEGLAAKDAIIRQREETIATLQRMYEVESGAGEMFVGTPEHRVADTAAAGACDHQWTWYKEDFGDDYICTVCGLIDLWADREASKGMHNDAEEGVVVGGPAESAAQDAP